MIISLNPAYVALIQKPMCCAVACLQMILFRNGLGLFDQEDLAFEFGIKIMPDYQNAFSQPLHIINQPNVSGGMQTVESEKFINDFFTKKSVALRATAHRASTILHLADFLMEHLKANHDIWIEYHANDIYSDEASFRSYIHDGLIESYDEATSIVTVTDSVPLHKQRLKVSLDTISKAISTHFGRETGFVIIESK